ncbi:MAG: hypothetical protein V3T72_07570, partial [Thermoanaerobaculia bacterium]
MSCCPCDRFDHPPKPDIAAGLSALPRQLAGFPEYRLAMLRELRTHLPLSDWRAREGDDLGLMLIEMWAYVLDVLGFYDERIADESYLRTADLRPSLRKLVELIGYRPRPALAASVVLAAIAEGRQPVALPAATAFRSEAFEDQPPQVFETEVASVIAPRQNQWTLGPVRSRFLDPSADLLLDAKTAQLARDQLALFAWGSKLEAGKVVEVEPIEGLDGETYIRPRIVPEPELGSGVELDQVEVRTPSLTATPNRFHDNPVFNVASATYIVLDNLYNQIIRDSVVVVQRGDPLRAARVKEVALVDVEIADGATVPATRIRIKPKLAPGWTNSPDRLTVHFHTVDGGRLTRVADTLLTKQDLEGGAALEGPVEPLETDPPDRVQLHDADQRGVEVGGTVKINAAGQGTLTLDQDEDDFLRPLRTPVEVYGNLIAASRGESVVGEVLGSGAAARALQSFTLAQKPLTYLNDPSGPDGRRSTLAIRVAGRRWKEVPSFFGSEPGDEVFIVR